MKAISRLVTAGALISSMFFSINAFAAPELSLTVKAERDAKVTDENGKVTTKRISAESASPGETIFYTITYSNTGDETATNVKVDNPVPEGASYLDGSAWGDNSELLFSIDSGKTYKKASALTYNIEGKTRTATPEQYNAVRWVVKEIKAGSDGSVGFSAVVK